MFLNWPIRVVVQQPAGEAKSGIPAWLKDLGPLVTGVGTLFLSVMSLIFVQGQEHEKQRVAAADLRQKEAAIHQSVFANVTKTDAEQEVAALTMLTMADYGESALPTLRVLLSGSDSISKFGKLVVQKWMDGGDPKARARLLQELAAYARSPNKLLRLNSYMSLVAISPVLTAEEARGILPLLVERFGTGPPMLESDANVARTACPLMSLRPFDYADIRLPLRNIAIGVPTGTVAAKQAFEVILKRAQAATACKILSDLQGMSQDFASVSEVAKKACGQ